jgi:hypothetical protein
MSVATAFRFPHLFPFCVTDISAAISSQTNASHVANLTAAEVMGFAWSLETFSVSTTGHAYYGGLTADGVLDFTLNPIASNTFNEAQVSPTCMIYGNASAVVSFASFPAQRRPVERICPVTPPITGCVLGVYAQVSNENRTNIEFDFWVGTDPGNAGKYRVYYDFSVNAEDTLTETIFISWSNISATYLGDAITNGQFVISGITFDYYSYKTPGATHDGGTLSATYSSYTYS